MFKRIWFPGLLALALAGAVAAEDGVVTRSAEDDEASDAVADRAPRRHIRVLQHPYDIASFYRSSDGSGYGYGYFGYDRQGNWAPTDRYPIASYYRSRQQAPAYGYWSAPTWSPLPRRGLSSYFRARGTRRGELYLFAPTILAPVGPWATESLRDSERDDRP
jgi:hypothetical protein